MTERLVKFQDKELTKELLWDIYFHGALRKSIDWFFQNELEITAPYGAKSGSKRLTVSLFFRLQKLFLGNRMPRAARKES